MNSAHEPRRESTSIQRRLENWLVAGVLLSAMSVASAQTMSPDIEERVAGSDEAIADGEYKSVLPAIESITRGSDDPIFRVVGGRPAKAGAWASMVPIFLGDRAICGGTIIDKEWVLTAAHCVRQRSPQELSVREATIDLRAGGRLLKIAEIHIHENYKSGPPANDVALLRLQESAKSPRQLLMQQSAIPAVLRDGAMATVVGFGRIQPRPAQPGPGFQTGTTSDRLLQADVPIVSLQKCIERYGAQRISEGTICAGFDEGGHDACQGDSGGPLFARGPLAQSVQVAVVSWGSGCAQPKSYGVYTSLAAFEPWIRQRVPDAQFISTAPSTSAESAAIAGIPAYVTQIITSLLGNTSSKEPSKLAQVSVDLVQGTTLRVNDLIQIRVTSSITGKLVVFNQDSDGKMFQIFPNRFTGAQADQAPTMIKAGYVVTAPAPGDRFRLRITPPLGKNKIYAMVLPVEAKIDDLTNPHGDMKEIKNPQALLNALAEREIRTRGIRVEATMPTDRAVGFRDYEIVP
jgi:secreted trypsin-like serine protease